MAPNMIHILDCNCGSPFIYSSQLFAGFFTARIKNTADM
jgi:hypothetical protein